jgi:hypothetical protein
MQFLGPSLRERVQNYYKIRHESEYLFRMRKEITTNYKFKKNCYIPQTSQNPENNMIFLLID